MASSALKVVNGVARMRTVGVEVQEDGSQVVSEASVLNFTSNMDIADQGSGTVNISSQASSTPATTIYDETYTVPGGGLSSGSNITLPNSGTYENKDLRVYVNGQLWEDGVDFDYVGAAGPGKTEIQILQDLEAGELVRFRVQGTAISIYDETVVIGAGGLVAGSNITLPNSETYDDIDLQVYLDGHFLQVVEDYNYVGSIPRTQIQTVFDLNEGERVRFRIEE